MMLAQALSFCCSGPRLAYNKAMKLDDLIAAFSQTYQLPDVSAGEDGSYQLVFDGVINLECRREGMGAALLITTLAQLPDTLVQATPMLEKVMHYAYARMSSHRLILCLDADHRLLAYQRLPISMMNAVAFSQAMSGFVNQAEEFLRLAQSGVR